LSHARLPGKTLLAFVALALLACWGEKGPTADPNFGVEIVNDPAIVDFQTRADAFYVRLTRRRVNTIATFNDRVLREYFQTEAQYSDYYSSLAEALTEAHFEKNRPLEGEVREFLFDAPGKARVRYRFVGLNSKPLHFWKTSLEREDHWERVEGKWWIVPGRP
jgi:hypothetical protein